MASQQFQFQHSMGLIKTMILSDFALPRVRSKILSRFISFSDDKTFDDLENKISAIDLEAKN